MCAIPLIALTFCSCIFSAGPVTVQALRPIEPTSKALTLLSDGPYLEDMSSALSKEGFNVTGPVLPGKAFSTRYGFRFYIQTGQAICVFTGSIIGDAAFTLVDLNSGENVVILKQYGATGPCSSVDPVYPGIAAELSKLWIVPKE